MENFSTTNSPIKLSTTINHNQVNNVLSVWDYVIFVGMLLISGLIGIYFGFAGPKQNKEIYLLGGRNMKVLPVALSLIASAVSGLAIVALPSDVYTYGSNSWWLTVSMLISCVINGFIFLPIFFNLSLTSIYEYFSLRFDSRVRTLASFLFTLSTILYNPMVIYIPALVFAQVTGLNLYLITIITCSLCTFYTTIGGLKAVIWTDVFQFFGILISVVAISILGLSATGGFESVWKSAVESDRITLDFSWEPFVRDSLWSVLIGASFQYITKTGVNQGTMQKLFSLPTLKKTRQALAIYCIGYCVIISFSVFIGNIIYARYKDCDPIEAKLVEKSDQIIPYFVMDVAGNVPGIAGLFLAGIFSASLSSFSALMNTISATIFEDFVSPWISSEIVENHTGTILKGIVVLTGIVSTGLVYVIANIGSIFTVFIHIQSISNGPLVGLFLIGVFIPFVNAQGALYSGISGLIFITWITSEQLWYKSKKIIRDLPKPISVEGCKTFINTTTIDLGTEEEKPFVLYRLSAWYNTVLCLIVMILVALVISCITKKKGFLVKPELVDQSVRCFTQKLQLSTKDNNVI